jgi:hypothetical protein
MGFKIRIKIVDIKNDTVDDVNDIDELVECLDDYIEKGNVKEVLVVVK